MGPGSGWWEQQPRRATVKEPPGVATTEHPALHSVPCPCLSVPQCKLLIAILPEDETGCPAHQGLQAQDQRWLSSVQTAHSSLLLPCQTLPREQMPCAILSQYQTQTSTAADPASPAAGSAHAQKDGYHEHPKRASAKFAFSYLSNAWYPYTAAKYTTNTAASSPAPAFPCKYVTGWLSQCVENSAPYYCFNRKTYKPGFRTSTSGSASTSRSGSGSADRERSCPAAAAALQGQQH